ncbi:hypothetical protein O181_091002 [Austropuccinia psidii MF-1]|uniref:Retrotransposon gag domain-containing protein n=1 Tax=Austropuccinia psidii MF-1 TaxID=1389203 RepID=A0A9Q3P869_9BASI|nr:hypothetical protein [Austropuccinia psidii MF-1]
MVHTRNGSNYSVQPDGCGQGRGNTKYRSLKSFSRKTHMEDARATPHSPRDEPPSSGSNRNVSMPIQKLVQRSQRRGVVNMPKPLAGGHELLLTHQELSGSGEEHRTLRRLEPIVLQRQIQEYKELVEEPKSFIHRPEERIGNDSSFGDRRPSGVYQLQTRSRSVQIQAQRTSEEAERFQKPSRQGQRQSQLAQTYPTRVQVPQIGAFSHGQCLQYGKDSYGIHSQGAGKDEQNFSTEMIQKIHFVKTSIDVEIGKIDAKLTKMTLDISDLKKNDKHSAEMHKSIIAKLELLTNTCDRLESKYHVQEDEMEHFSTRNINDQLRVLKDFFLAVAENTSQFATHLERSDSERKKLKEEILAQVEKIHKNYESNPHMPRHSTPSTEEKLSVKESLTPFVGENGISVKDIPKFEEWPTFSGEGEYNHIEFIRTIDMLQEDFQIPDEIIVGKLHSLFTRTAKKWYYKMRQDQWEHDWSWWKSEVITKWANNSWRFKMENAFDSAIFNSGKDKPITWFFKQKDRLSALHPDMSDTMINMKILRECGGELENAIKCRCVEPCSAEDYINAMEDIITRTRTGKTWTKIPMESKMIQRISREDRKPERSVFKCHKCGRTSNLANTCTKKTKINEVQVIEEVKCTEEKEESDPDYAVSEDTSVEDYLIENKTAFFEVTEVHTHLP